MTTRLFACAVATLTFLTAAARAEESLEELKVRLQKNWEPWKGCEPGSWIQMRTKTQSGNGHTESEHRQTLVSRNEKGLTVEIRTVKRSKNAEGNEVVELGEPYTSTTAAGSQAANYEDFKDLRHETIEVAGTKLDCRVIEATMVYKYPQPVNGQTEMRTKMTLWISPEVREMGGLVKTEADTDNQGAGFGAGSSDMTLIDRDQELKIGDLTVKCSIYRFGTATGKESMTGSGEMWFSADLPSGYAKSKMVMHMKQGAGTTRSESEMEVTGMEIVKPKTD